MKSTLLMGVLTLLSYLSIAQDSEKKDLPSSFNVKLGPSNINGDGSKKIGLSLGIGYEKNLSKHLILGVSLDGGILKGGAYQGYSYTSKTSFFQILPSLKYNIFKPDSKFSIAPLIGAGLVIYNGRAYENNNLVRFVNGTASSTKSTGNLVYLLGLDFGIKVGKNTFGLEYVANYVQSDRFDGTIGTKSGSNGHTAKGKITDLPKGNAGKTQNDHWHGFRLKLSIPINKESKENNKPAK